MKKEIISLLIMISICYGFIHDQIQWPIPAHAVADDIVSEARIELGRKLFFDERLSADNSISCASCHSPYNSFSHPDHALSHGINNRKGTRNAPALINLAWKTSYMWDGRVTDPSIIAGLPITHPDEMGQNLDSALREISSDSYYQSAFENAFKDSGLCKQNLLYALSCFTLSLVSNQSKYDSVMRKESVFTSQEKHGYRLFKKHCNSCHTEPLFSKNEFKSNGLLPDSLLNDKGKGNITGKEEDLYLFMIPTLRNIQYTFPYMHDGRFKRLRQVLGHYTDGINNKSHVSTELRKNIVLSEDEKSDLIAFLFTLTDRDFMFNKNHNSPY